MTSELDALHEQYVKAIAAYSDASAALYHHTLQGTSPTSAEIQREDDARIVLEAARRAYYAATGRS